MFNHSLLPIFLCIIPFHVVSKHLGMNYMNEFPSQINTMDLG